MPILTIASSKGGVGKTTVASSLAAVLGEKTPVLAVDCDSNVSLTHALGRSAEAGADLGTALVALVGGDGCDLGERIISTNCAGVDLLPANTVSMVRAERAMTGEPGSERLLRNGLHPLQERYDWIIIDTPAALNNLTLAGTIAADAVIGVFQSEPLSIDGVMQLVNWLAKYGQEGLGLAEARLLGMVNNMYEPRRLLTSSVNEAVERTLAVRGHYLFRTKIPRRVNVASATWAGSSVTSTEPDSPAALALRELADEVLERVAAL